jgi:hypothetical protein
MPRSSSRRGRDRYPCDFGEPYFLYDGPRRLFSYPQAEFEYWSEHIWRGFDGAVGKLAELGGQRERSPKETHEAYRDRVRQRIDLRYVVTKNTMRGLSYDLAVLHANYIIDRRLRGNAAICAFQEALADLIESVRMFWRESSKQLGLSCRKQEKGGIDFVRPFHEVATDLRALLASCREAKEDPSAGTQIPDPTVVPAPSADGGRPRRGSIQACRECTRPSPQDRAILDRLCRIHPAVLGICLDCS